jgi:hypothetical protein
MIFFKESKHQSTIAYLPSHTTIWATSGYDFLREKLISVLKNQLSGTLQKVICPIHVGGCHWGILYIDLLQEIAYYDDGMHMEPPSNISLVVINIMKVLKSFCPHISSKWTSKKISFERFGMPRQPKTGQGSSSCGIGVIFAARDIIQHGSTDIPKFSWSLCESSKLRKQIMHELINYRELNGY